MFAYWHLRDYLGLSTDNIWIPDMVQGLAYVDEDILRRFHCDCMLLEPRYAATVPWNVRGKYTFAISGEAHPMLAEDGTWTLRKGEASMQMPPGGFFFDGAWLRDWGSGTNEERLDLYAREAERIYKETDFATIYSGYSQGLSMPHYGGGDIEDAMHAYEDPDEVHERRERALAGAIERMQTVIERFGQYVQLVTMSDDMGTQSGLMCSPWYIEEFCMPYYRRSCDFVHEYSDIKVLLHSCGAVERLIPMFIEAGIDVLNPVQISAAGMDPRTLKAKYGDDICFWGGGCNTQHVLGSGTPEEVADNVRELMGIFKPNSGYVFNQVHNVMGDVPPENIVAMLETAYAESFSSC